MRFSIMLQTPVEATKERSRTLRAKLGGVRGKATNGRPAQPGGPVTGAAVVRTSCWRRGVVVHRGAREQPGTPGRVGVGPGKCRGLATCVHDRAPGEPPGDRPGSRSTPACQATSREIHNTP